MVIGRRVVRMDEAGSTNDVAKGYGKTGEPEGLVVLAGRQTAGKGRMGRGWSSPEGGLYVSVLLRPKMRSQDLLRMTVFSCVPVAKAIEEVCDQDVRIKWPNDLFLNGRKVGGILVEGVSKGAAIEFVVIGVGLNVNSTLESIGEEGATSLEEESGKAVDVARLLDSLVRDLDIFYKDLLRNKIDEDEYVKRSCTLGRQIEARVGKETFRGKALYIGPDGALVLRSEEGLVLRLSWVNETSIHATNSEGTDGATLRKD
ncbi:MAG TPA: biotin--[acetyl-CoA-carboxylase] ligase [Methanomassiliicoccales archaeon]|nr:biotin--[acetyl-CoA-carboxylase] ligase [Methanomassiliicoccales archaeon]